MNLLNQVLVLLFSLTGTIFGLILALIAPEELKAGKKYFILLKRTIFAIIFFLVNYYLYLAKNYYLLIPFTILAIVLFIIEFVQKKPIYELFNYLIFVIPYFFVMDNQFHLLLAGLIFIYGLPTGTLLRKAFKNV
ncbi:hypothetical protein HON71_01105 [Candidatus Woesearchaeota archaeon]|jgi:hypothetical protein|nr:hypothetical protein [Candidatus Woesearchaeota archaeon]MBT5342954.1 hypothetical protein [Candidatus Woesearchaeota archaeon]